MDEERPVADRDSDSSSGLPDINDFFSDVTAFEAAKLKKGDVVWAEYKDLFWPALVRTVYKKNKKVFIWYLDSPGTTFKLPFKKIRDFNDSNVFMHNFQHLENNPLREKHNRVLSRAEHFVDRRKRGIEDDVIEFFNLSKPVFLFDDIPGSSEFHNERASTLESSEFDNEIASTPESSEFKNDSGNLSPEKTEEDGNVNLEDNSDDESAVKNDVQHHARANSPRVSESSNSYSDEMIAKILLCIEAGHLNKYLLDIYNCKIENERHNMYMKALEEDKTRTLWFHAPPYIPINNEKLLPVTFYLYKLFEAGIGSLYYRNEYIVMVWLPEAVKKAVSLIEEGSVQLPVDEGREVSSSFSEASDLYRNPVNYLEFIEIELPESTLVQLESSESPSNSSVTYSFTRLKRNPDDVSSVLNDDSTTPDMEAGSSNKKKLTVIKRQKVQPETRRSLRSTAARKKAESPEEYLVESIPAVKTSRNKTLVSKRGRK